MKIVGSVPWRSGHQRRAGAVKVSRSTVAMYCQSPSGGTHLLLESLRKTHGLRRSLWLPPIFAPFVELLPRIVFGTSPLERSFRKFGT